MNKGYKYRIYPNQQQKTMIEKTFGCTRFIYNKMLANRKEFYGQYGKYISPAELKKEFEWLKEVDSQALCNSQMNLEIACNNFYRKKRGSPKFKKKSYSKNSYTTNNNNNTIRVNNDGTIRLPKLNKVKIKMHRELPNNSTIKSATISKTASGKYFISILIKYENEIEKKILSAENVIGLDYSSKSLFIDSEGDSAKYPKFYTRSEEKLKRAKAKLLRCKLGSKNREKQIIRVAKIYEKIDNQRRDYMHKITRAIVEKYNAVIIEDLDMKDIAKKNNLGKSTYDNKFWLLKRLLGYKLTERGKAFVTISKWFPSSKMCRFCSNLNHALTLSDRVWTCQHCQEKIDRDLNAAINIKNEGCRILGIPRKED